MNQLPASAIASWVDDGPRSHPAVVDWLCPYGAHTVSFSAGVWRQIGRDHWHAEGSCPRCKGIVQLFTLNVGTGHKSLCGGSLYMFPPSKSLVPSAQILESAKLAEPLKRAYASAVNVVNVQEWSAAAVMCRRLIEGITKTALPATLSNETLAKQLEALPQHLDLARPLIELAHAVRKGGNLGAHFDLEREPNEQVATLMLELCEDLLEYLFALPGRIDELNVKLRALGKSA